MSQTGEKELQIYKVINRSTGEISHQPASNAEDACKQAGWLIGDCFVKPAIQRYKPVPDHEPIVLVRVPCEICPYQYAECRLPPYRKCPCRREMPDLNEWLKEITKSHLCEYVGNELMKSDYKLSQKWVSIAQAIAELSPQH